MPFIRVYTLCKSKKGLQTRAQFFFENYNLTSLDIYNGLSQVYYIKPEENNPLVYKGLKRATSNQRID